jgi:hypothetical protein
VLTDDEIELVFERLLGVQVRLADKQMIRMMGDNIGAMALYIWDHWMGSPDEDPSYDEVHAAVARVLSGE